MLIATFEKLCPRGVGNKLTYSGSDGTKLGIGECLFVRGSSMRTFNLHQLATFQVVAKHCSYVRAAEELHFSQPAVSAQIRQLEETLGVKLFDQIGRKPRAGRGDGHQHERNGVTLRVPARLLGKQPPHEDRRAVGVRKPRSDL